jgi:MFS transporter, AAHS family, 4-hydroxybenzoate transporter
MVMFLEGYDMQVTWLSDTKSVLFIPHARGSSLMVLCFLAGFFLVGSQIGLNSIAGTMYPTDIRATGAGWALGIGRIGSIVGPVLGGVFLSMRVPTHTLFLYTALVAVVCAASIALLWKISVAVKPTASPIPS